MLFIVLKWCGKIQYLQPNQFQEAMATCCMSVPEMEAPAIFGQFGFSMWFQQSPSSPGVFAVNIGDEHNYPVI